MTFHYIRIDAARCQIGYWDARGHWHRLPDEPHVASVDKARSRTAELNRASPNCVDKACPLKPKESA